MLVTSKVRDIIVVDTNIVSQLWRRSDLDVVEFYDNALVGARLLISFMTEKELRRGMLASGWSQARRESWLMDLRRYAVVHSSTELVAAAAELQHLCGSQRPSEADLWIAATAYMLDCRLATEDQRLVDRVRDKVEVITTHGE